MAGPSVQFPACYTPGPDTVNLPCLGHSSADLAPILTGGPFSRGPWVAADPATCDQICCYSQ